MICELLVIITTQGAGSRAWQNGLQATTLSLIMHMHLVHRDTHTHTPSALCCFLPCPAPCLLSRRRSTLPHLTSTAGPSAASCQTAATQAASWQEQWLVSAQHVTADAHTHTQALVMRLVCTFHSSLVFAMISQGLYQPSNLLHTHKTPPNAQPCLAVRLSPSV